MRRSAVERHGWSKTPEYRTWSQMWWRVKHDRHYKAHGVKVHSRWRFFTKFLADVGPRPSSRHSIDRINTWGHYAPANVRWADVTIQRRNRCDIPRIRVGGWSLTIAEWADAVGLSRQTLWQRLVRQGWTPELAIFTPADHHPCSPIKNHPELASRLGGGGG